MEKKLWLASFNDYKERYFKYVDVEDAEKNKILTLINDCSLKLRGYGIDPEKPNNSMNELEWIELIKTVVCNSVNRAYITSQSSTGASQMTQSAGVYSETFTFANPSGDIYFTREEKKLLGISGMKIYSIKPQIGDTHDKRRDNKIINSTL